MPKNVETNCYKQVLCLSKANDSVNIYINKYNLQTAMRDSFAPIHIVGQRNTQHVAHM